MPGTALGDWMADGETGLGLGYQRGAIVFGAGLGFVATAYFRTPISRVALFWMALIPTRPLGAMVGGFLDKPRADGGFELSRCLATAVLAAFIVVCIVVLPQRAARRHATAA